MNRRLILPAAFLLAGVAHAECPTITPQVDALAPTDAATGLPENAAIAFGITPRFAGYAPSVTLTASSGGGPIAGALVAGPAESFLFRPDNPLSPNQQYEVQVVDSSGTGTPMTTTFTTGTGTDVTDPIIANPPVLTIAGYTDPIRTDECLLPGYFVIEADWEDVTGEASVLYVLDANFEDLIPQEIQSQEMVGQGLVSLASTRTFNAPANSEARVRIYAVDGAGRQNNSPEGIIVTPSEPGASGDGCGAAACCCELSGTAAPLSRHSAGTTIVSALMLALAIVLRRR